MHSLEMPRDIFLYIHSGQKSYIVSLLFSVFIVSSTALYISVRSNYSGILLLFFDGIAVRFGKHCISLKKHEVENLRFVRLRNSWMSQFVELFSFTCLL